MKRKWSVDEIKGKILYKLARLGKFKHSHTSIDNLPKGFPSHLKGKVKECVLELKKEGVLFEKPTGYGFEVSVNSKMHMKIMEYIKIFKNSDD